MSQRAPIEKEVEGLSFVFTMMPPTRAMHWVNRLLKPLLTGVGVLGEAAARGGMEADMPISNALSDALDKLEPTQLDAFMTEMAQYCTHKEIPLRDTFEAVFLGRPGAMYAWFFAAVEVQFADFLPVLGRRLGAVVGEVKGATASLSQNTSTG